MSFIQTIKPRVSKRTLLYIAAVVWTFAGGMLICKGILLSIQAPEALVIKISISILGGAAFYRLLFSTISRKHTKRIVELKMEKPCLFSFFNFRSYILMAVMITAGVMLRKSGIIPPQYLLVLYFTMGIPLFLSSFRFYYHGLFYDHDRP
ncbi:MAG: hypothetical protein V2B15_12705 [Bacteroidota bacterium]